MTMQWPTLPAKYFTSETACSCPGWYWRHRCRHVEELRGAVELVAAHAAKWDEAGKTSSVD